MRGLKLELNEGNHCQILSHPTWVRGLKLVIIPVDTVTRAVAPHVGAWIETVESLYVDDATYVAPHVGAWIETFASTRCRSPCQVAPHVGAWIET